jgi:hypothetical protein
MLLKNEINKMSFHLKSIRSHIWLKSETVYWGFRRPSLGKAVQGISIGEAYSPPGLRMWEIKNGEYYRKRIFS